MTTKFNYKLLLILWSRYFINLFIFKNLIFYFLICCLLKFLILSDIIEYFIFEIVTLKVWIYSVLFIFKNLFFFLRGKFFKDTLKPCIESRILFHIIHSILFKFSFLTSTLLRSKGILNFLFLKMLFDLRVLSFGSLRV